MGRRRSRSQGYSGVSRRKLLAGMGAGLAGLGGVSLSANTGAFSSVGANRATSLSVANDPNAIVGLTITDPVTFDNREPLVDIENNTSETIDVNVSLDTCSQGTLFHSGQEGCSVNLTIDPNITKTVDIRADVTGTIPFTISASSSDFSLDANRETTAEL